MLHINLHILYISFIKVNLNLKEFEESNNYIKVMKKTRLNLCLDEIYFKLKLHLNLSIKSDFEENSQFSTSLCYSCMNVIEFFSMSCHIMTVLMMKNELYHNLKCEP